MTSEPPVLDPEQPAPPVVSPTVPVPAPFDMRGYPGVALSTFPWRGWMVLIVAIMVLAPVFVAVMLARMGVFDPLGSDLSRSLVSLLPYVFGITSAWLIVRMAHGRLAEAVGLRRFEVGAGVLAAAVGAIVGRILTIQITSWLVLIGMDPSGSDQFSLWGDSVLGLVTVSVIAVVIAPICEEVLFRGVLLSWLHDRWGPTVGVLGSSILFGASHLDWFLLIPLTVTGIILARLYLSTRSLWVSIGAHALFNLSGVVLYMMLRLIEVA